MKRMIAMTRFSAFGNQRGGLLVGLVVAITAIGALGAGMAYMTSGSTYSQLFTNQENRAYFMAEAGGRYAMLRLQENPLPTVDEEGNELYPQASGTFTLSNGDTFQIQTAPNPDNPTTRIRVVSTGTVNSGWFQARRMITYNINRQALESGGSSGYWSGFPDDGSMNVIDEGEGGAWSPVTGNVSYVTEGQADGGAVMFAGDAGLIALNWYDEDSGSSYEGMPDLASMRDANDGLLSYEMQVKVKVNTPGTLGDFYMHGLSFRLEANPDSAYGVDSTYGISFFIHTDHSTGGKGKGAAGAPPDWYSDLAGFEDVPLDTPAIVLWKKVNGGSITLMDFRFLPGDYGELVDGDELLDWSTMVLSLTEEFVDPDNSIRQNRIKAYVQGPGEIPKGTITWDYSQFMQVDWLANGSEVVDGTLTSENFDSDNPPNEIGLHAFYDAGPGAGEQDEKQFFADFSMPVGGGIDDDMVDQY